MLLAKGHIQTRAPPVVLENHPYWYKADQFCAYHQGGSGHNIENCLSFKSDVQRLVKNGVLSFKDTNLNVQTNLLPQHEKASVNLIDDDPGSFYQIHDVCLLGTNLVKKHYKQSGYGHVPPHNYHQCDICSKDNQGCIIVQASLQEQMDLGWIQDHRIRGINMVQESHGIVQNFDIRAMNVDLVALHSRQSQHHTPPLHDYNICSICSKDNQGCSFVQKLSNVKWT